MRAATLAQSRIDALAAEREAGGWTCWPKSRVATWPSSPRERQRDIAEPDIAQRQRTVAGARQRLHAGASPESVVLTRASGTGPRRTRSRARRAAIGGRATAPRRAVGRTQAGLRHRRGDPLFAGHRRFRTRWPIARAHAGTRAVRRRTPHSRSAAAAGAHRSALPISTGRSACAACRTTDDFALVGSVSMPLGSRAPRGARDPRRRSGT